MNKVKNRLKRVPGVNDVEINERTGSVLVHHEENKDVLELIGSAMEEVAGDLFDVLVEMEGEQVPGLSVLAHMVKSKVGNLDTKTANATGNWIDLKTIVPLGLMGAAIYKMIQDRAWMSEVPAFALFYYAFDSYMKFHGPSVRAISVAEREQENGVLQNPVQQEMRKRGSQSV
jgi:copper chaperone CopZ